MYTDYSKEENQENQENYYYDDNPRKPNKEQLKKMVIFIVAFVGLLVLIILIAKGCSNKDDNKNQVTNVVQPAIVFNKTSVALEVGETFKLETDVLNSKNQKPVVTWYSDDSSVASVDADGTIIAVGEGKTNIIATYQENQRIYKNQCSVVVTSKIVKLESIDFGQDNIQVKKGESVLLQINSTPATAKVENLVFSSDNESVATVNQNGYVKAIAKGEATIEAKALNGEVTDKILIIVTEDTNTKTTIEPTGIQISRLSNGLTVGTKAVVIYEIQPSNATNRLVTWTSSNPRVATVNNGIVTGVGVGSCTIIGTTSNNISARYDITVSSNTVAVSKISINGATSITMQTGGTKLLSYTITPSNATNKKVSYTTSNKNVVMVDSNGLLVAVGAGNAVVGVTTEDGKKTAMMNVTVVGESQVSPNPSSGEESNNSNSGGSSLEIPNVTETTGNVQQGEKITSCSSYDMIQITHNEVGKAVVSSISFKNTKPFTSSKTPTIEITEFLSCLKYANYFVYYGTTETNIGKQAVKNGIVQKKGDTIPLNNNSGYYKILVQGITTNNQYLTKYYYATVQKTATLNDSRTKNNITLSYTKSCNGSNGTYLLTAKNEKSNIISFKYCFSYATGVSGCSASAYQTLYSNATGVKTISKTISNNYYKTICMQATSYDKTSHFACFENIGC